MNTRTHDAGPFFCYRYKKIPFWSRILHLARSWETDPPYRLGRSLTVHLWPLRQAFGVGFWWSLGITNEDELDRHIFNLPEESDENTLV